MALGKTRKYGFSSQREKTCRVKDVRTAKKFARENDETTLGCIASLRGRRLSHAMAAAFNAQNVKMVRTESVNKGDLIVY